MNSEQTVRSHEFRKEMLREQIGISRALMAAGYYPHTIKFGNNGQVWIEGRPAEDTDQKLIDRVIKELADLDGGTPFWI
jgi:hypothetical protein